MPYLICESCGGYYELMEEESPEDFDNCQCGGDLRLVDSINETEDKIEDTEKQHLICPHCGNKEYQGVFCSKCGGKLITLKSDAPNFEHTEEVKKLSENAKNFTEIDLDFPGEPIGLFERIRLIAVFGGVGFFIVTALISMAIFLALPHSNSSFGFLVYIVTFSILVTISGAITAYISKSNDYFDGTVNGLTVGVIVGSVTGILTLSVLYLLINTLLYGVLGALGGMAYIWIKNSSKQG